MKKNIIRSVKHLILLSLLFFVANSCSDDNLNEFEIRKMIEEEIRKNNLDLEFTQWEIVIIPVEGRDKWEWNSDAGRYETFHDLPELTKFIYESGAQIAYAFVEDPKYGEIQKTLPFVHTNKETISSDYHFGDPSSVAFYIQPSDYMKADSILDDYYDFRIVLIW